MEYVRVVVVARLNRPLLVVVRPLQNRPAPFSQQLLGHSLDARLGLLAPRVEQHDLADAAAQKGLLLDIELRKPHEDVALDVVGWQGAVVEGLEEELDVLEEVGIGVEDGMSDVVAVHHGHNVWEELELVNCGLAMFAGLVVLLAGSIHHLIEANELIINLVLKILS